MNQASADTLYFGEREWQLVYRVALRVLKAPDQAEDAAQDALLNAYAARESFAGRAQPDSWLYRIAFNTALSHLRRPFVRRYAATDVHQAIDRRSDDSDDQDPEKAAMASQLASSLAQCLSTLRPKDRMAFTERFLLGTSEKELGSLLGVSTNAAKQRAFRARRSVRSCFACAEAYTNT
jgi:RNA polymerase sigma-70 factor (ECF subfamily)